MMRKIQILGCFAVLFVVVLLCGSTARAVEYGLKIAGVEVTDKNCNDLSGIAPGKVKVDGHLRYDYADNTLFMKGVSVNVTEGNAITVTSELRIVVEGQNTIETTANTFIALSAKAKIRIGGSGTFITKGSFSGIDLDKGISLVISNITLEASGKYGISGSTDKEKVVINGAHVTLSGNNDGSAICRLGSFKLDDCKIVEPAGAKFESFKHTIMLGINKVKEVKIEPVIYYGLKIAGVEVTSENCNDLSGISPAVSVVDGHLRYDHANQTLSMKGVTINSPTIGIENSSIEGLIIDISGENKLTSLNKSTTGLAIAKNTILQGDGKFIVKSENAPSIYVFSGTLTISSIIVEATGEWGISGVNAQKNEKLIIKNATVTATGTEAGIADFVSFTTEGCKIITPKDGRFDETKHAVVNAEGNVAKEVKIERAASVTGVTVSPTTVNLNVKATHQLSISVEPATATNKRYTCQSDNESVATVTNTGLITAVSVGSATITITTEDGNKTATCAVKVSQSTSPDNPNAVEDAIFAGVLVAPNPFSAVLRISNVREGMRYILFDAQGVSVLSGELPEGDTMLSTSGFPSGLYLLQLQTPDGTTKHWRVVK